MKIYSITQDDKYKTLIDADQLDGLQGFAIKLAYGEVSVEGGRKEYQLIYNSDDKKKAALSDFYTFFRPVLVVSKRAYEEIGSLQSLPCVNVSGPRVGDMALYVGELISDMFNAEKSDYDKGEGGYVVYKAVLRYSQKMKSDIFRIPENPQVIYVSQVFKDSVELNGLKGLSFREIERSD